MLIVWTGKERLSSSMPQFDNSSSVTDSQLVCHRVGSQSSDCGQAGFTKSAASNQRFAGAFGGGFLDSL
jgi:hypothetical protein